MKKIVIPILFPIAVILFFACDNLPSQVQFTIIYDGNGHTSGSTPIDNNKYISGQSATILDNVGSLLKINVTGISYALKGWNTLPDGNGVTYMPGDNYSMGSASITLYARWIPYVIRDLGPAGGYIFIDKGAYSDGWRYIEAAPTDQSAGIQWHNGGYVHVGGTSLSCGAGSQNTDNIILAQGAGAYAASLCPGLSINGFSNWFLPSSCELNSMYSELHLHGLGEFQTVGYWNYWSSSEFDITHAYMKNFANGTAAMMDKNNTFAARVTRTF